MNFNEKCYDVLRKVPRGRVTTYGGLARAVGKPRAARAVGNAMKKSPGIPNVPCHRVVKSNGEVGGFNRGNKKKIEMLRKEGVEIIRGKVNLSKFMYKF